LKPIESITSLPILDALNVFEELDVRLLSIMPRKQRLRDFVLQMLQNQSIGNAKYELVEKKNAQSFVDQLRSEIDSHIGE